MAPRKSLMDYPNSISFGNSLPSCVSTWNRWTSGVNGPFTNYAFHFPSIVLMLQFHNYTGTLYAIQMVYPHFDRRRDLFDVLKADTFKLYYDFREQCDPMEDRAVFEALVLQMVDRVMFYNLPTDIGENATYAGGWRPARFIYPGYHGRPGAPITYIPDNRSSIASAFSVSASLTLATTPPSRRPFNETSSHSHPRRSSRTSAAPG
jgi:hypothetical protein